MKKERKKNSELTTKVVCPQCGAEFAIANKTHVATGVVVGKDAGLGTIYPEVVGQSKPMPTKATERIEALKAAGIDVSCLFAMTGADGDGCVVEKKGSDIRVLTDDDPIFDMIKVQGTVPNRKLFRRWVMAQMFHMLANEQRNRNNSITNQIRRKGADYMWRQLEDELRAQCKMLDHGDKTNYDDRSHWFNSNLVVAMMEDYLAQVRKHIKTAKVHKCKNVPYKRICGENVFVADIAKRVLIPITRAIREVQACKTVKDLYYLVIRFNRNIRKRRGWEPQQCNAWIDAYKGAGAFFTMQNLIRFHGCRFVYDYKHDIYLTEKEQSYAWLQKKNQEYRCEGWRMIGLLRKFLEDNHIDINKKMAEWRKRK